MKEEVSQVPRFTHRIFAVPGDQCLLTKASVQKRGELKAQQILVYTLLSRSLSCAATETVVPGKALAAIAGFVDLGKRLKDRLKQLDKEGQIHFHGWGYDWRRSLELSS